METQSNKTLCLDAITFRCRDEGCVGIPEIWSSGVLTTLFVAAFLLFYFPQLETFKAAGVEVRLRQTLDRAEEIIERLKKLAEANAKVTYMTLAWGNRFGTPSAVDKQRLLDETDAQLRALNVDEAERKQITLSHCIC
jgi:hypothetical protein